MYVFYLLSKQMVRGLNGIGCRSYSHLYYSLESKNERKKLPQFRGKNKKTLVSLGTLVFLRISSAARWRDIFTENTKHCRNKLLVMLRAAQRNIIVQLTDGVAYKLYGTELRLQKILSQRSLCLDVTYCY